LSEAVTDYSKVQSRQSSGESPSPPSPSIRATNNTKLSRRHRYTDRRPNWQHCHTIFPSQLQSVCYVVYMMQVTGYFVVWFQ